MTQPRAPEPRPARPGARGGSPALPTPPFQASGHHNRQGVNICCFPRRPFVVPRRAASGNTWAVRSRRAGLTGVA